MENQKNATIFEGSRQKKQLAPGASAATASVSAAVGFAMRGWTSLAFLRWTMPSNLHILDLKGHTAAGGKGSEQIGFCFSQKPSGSWNIN